MKKIKFSAAFLVLFGEMNLKSNYIMKNLYNAENKLQNMSFMDQTKLMLFLLGSGYAYNKYKKYSADKVKKLSTTRNEFAGVNVDGISLKFAKVLNMQKDLNVKIKRDNKIKRDKKLESRTNKMGDRLYYIIETISQIDYDDNYGEKETFNEIKANNITYINNILVKFNKDKIENVPFKEIYEKYANELLQYEKFITNGISYNDNNVELYKLIKNIYDEAIDEVKEPD
jgi:hypothetical protein